MGGLRESAKIGLKKAQITYIAGKSKNLTYEQVKDKIISFLIEILESTLLDIEEWINEKVPKRTGQLRENLIKNLQSSRVKNGILTLVIATSIDYAEEVNEMSTAQVRHEGTWREHSGKKAYAYYYGGTGAIFLDDPDAVGGFFELLIKFAKERVFINMSKMKSKYATMVSEQVKEL